MRKPANIVGTNTKKFLSYVSNIQVPLTSIRQGNTKSAIWITIQATLWGIRVFPEIDLSRVSELIRPGVEKVKSVPGNNTRPTVA